MNRDQIRRGLRNISTRATTIDAVSTEGESLVDEIIPLLQDRNEGVRWSVIKILSEIGDTRAVGSLIALIDQKKNAVAAADTLQSITGENFGADAIEWRRWAVKNADVRNMAGGGILSDEDLIAAAIRDLPLTSRGAGKEYCFDVSLPDGRSQQVLVDLACEDPNGRPIVQLSTPCGSADQDKYEDALKLNMSITYGAISLALLDDSLCFAMVDSYLRETVHPEDIAESIMSLARNGDSLEKSLSGEDQF